MGREKHEKDVKKIRKREGKIQENIGKGHIRKEGENEMRKYRRED